jgi:hypothetical protein
MKTGNNNIPDMVRSFNVRVPYFVGEYEPFLPLWNLRTVLDERLELANNANFANGDTLDNLIDEIAGQAIADSERQHTNHRDEIIRHVSNSMANRNACQTRLDHLRNELEAVDQQIAVLKSNQKLGGHYNG